MMQLDASLVFRPMAELTGGTQWIVLAAAVAGTAIVLFKPKFKPKKDPLERSGHSTSLAQQRAVERQMETLLVDLSEMARQVTANLDTRASKLEILLREADEKIASLTSLRHQNGGTSSMLTMTGVHSGSGSESQITEANLEPQPLDRPPSAYDADPRHAEVYLMADRGEKPAEIAAKLNRPSGEIQLILALRPRQT